MDNRDSKRSGMREQWRQYEESQVSVGVIFAGIAALFIAGIAAAFLYAKDTNLTQTASVPAAISNASAPSIARAPETTGSGAPQTTGSGGGINTTPPNVHPLENEERERP